jgi:hypothetical protein
MTESAMKNRKFECVRCGHCCMAVGRHFWTHGDFSKYPELQKLAETRTDTDEGLPCEMLQMKDGIAACKIELLYGKGAKPEVCRKYPDLECHQSQKMFKGQGFCYQVAG